MSRELTSAGHSLVAVQDNLIDAVWMDRPERPSTQLRTLGLEYTGTCKAPLTSIMVAFYLKKGSTTDVLPMLWIV